MGKSVTVTSLPVGHGRAGYRAPVGGQKCLVASFWTNKNATLHLWKQLCINRWVERNRVGDVSGGAIGARRTRGVARCDRLIIYLYMSALFHTMFVFWFVLANLSVTSVQFSHHPIKYAHGYAVLRVVVISLVHCQNACGQFPITVKSLI